VRLVVGLAALVVLAASAKGTAATTDASCDATGARAAFAEYVQAFNQGQYPRLQLLVAREPDFQWLTVAPPYGRVGQRAYNRSTLTAYFRARHAKREALKVVKFNFAGVQERDGGSIANFNGQLTRKAADLPLERRGFKAALRCGTASQFIVLSIGTKI
jgi:hypothetical protein